MTVLLPRTVADIFAPVVAVDPDREALVTRSGRWSYAELDRLASRAAHALAALGVRAGDRVAGGLPNDLDVILAFHGAMRLGAVWVGGGLSFLILLAMNVGTVILIMLGSMVVPAAPPTNRKMPVPDSRFQHTPVAGGSAPAV